MLKLTLRHPDLHKVFENVQTPTRDKEAERLPRKTKGKLYFVKWRDWSGRVQSSHLLTLDAAYLFHRRTMLRLLSDKWGPQRTLEWARSCEDYRMRRVAAMLKRELLRPAPSPAPTSPTSPAQTPPPQPEPRAATPADAPHLAARLAIPATLSLYLSTPSTP